ncbi:MAG: ROK family protein [Tissierellia bacterium]|nr:ROK family protein [Tissierellia bacterium]
MSKILGVDIGGTTMKMAVVEGGSLSQQEVAPTPGDPRDIVELLVRWHRDHPLPMGICCAGTVDPEAKAITELGGNIQGWRHFPLGEALAERGVSLAALENDANAALVAECSFGQLEDNRHSLLITLGTGIGGAYTLDGRTPLRGSRGAAMEIGHILLHPGGRSCACGQRGCAEEYLSARALRALMEGEGSSDTDLFLQSPRGGAYIEELAAYLLSLTTILDPRNILLGGGLVEYSRKLIPLLKEEMPKQSNGAHGAALYPAHLGNQGGIVGAAILAARALAAEA